MAHRSALGSGLQRLLLVLVLFCLTAGSIPFGKAQANYQPGVRPGDAISYGQVSASWVGDLSPQFPVADFLNVASVQNIITNVNQDNVTLQQTKIYNNGTNSRLHLLYNTQSGYANDTSTIAWVIAKDLVAPEAGTETPQAPTITATFEKVFLGNVRTVNVFSQSQVFSAGYYSIEEDFDQQTGILLSFTYNLQYSNIYTVTAHLNIVITQTSLWAPPVQPDFAIYVSPYGAIILKGSSVDSTISLQSLNSFQGTVSLSQTVSPTGPTVTLNQTTRAIPSGGIVNILLNFSTVPSVSAAYYSVNITATYGSLEHSTTLNVTVTEPGYNISPAQAYVAIPTNSSGTDALTLTSVGRFNGTVTLRVVPLTPGPVLSLNPSTITIKAGTNTTTITITTHLVPAGYYTLQVNGTGSLLQTAYIFLQVLPGPPDFTISLDPPFASSDPVTGVATTHIILTSVNEFVGTVIINDYFINGTSSTFTGLDNPTLDADRSTSIQYKVLSPPISSGCCGIVEIVATSGSISHSANFTINVPSGPDFTMTLSSNSSDLPQGRAANIVNVTVTNTGTITGPIELSATAPFGFYGTWSFSPSLVTLAPGASDTIVFAVSVNSPTLGKINFTMFAYDIDHFHTAQFALTVLSPSAGFNVATSSSTITVQPGASTTPQIVLTSIDSFYANVSMSASLESPGLLLGWSTQSLQLTANATISLPFSITALGSTKLGTYTVNVTAIGNGIVHTTLITIRIALPPSDFTIRPDQTQLNIQAGHSASVIMTVSGLYNFNGTINLNAIDAGFGPVLSFYPQTVVLNYTMSSSKTILTIALPADVTSGSTYTITISATNGTTTRQASIIVTATQSSGNQPNSTGGPITLYEIPLILLAAGFAASATIDLFMKRRGQPRKPEQSMGNRQPR